VRPGRDPLTVVRGSLLTLLMPDRLPSAASLAASTSLRAGSENASTQLEEEVVGLFDSLRAPVLRYLLGIGLAVEDGEEIVQEVFLALFRHLREGKPRDNLRGWVFRVAHNLGLKRRAGMARHSNVAGEGETGEVTDPSPNPEDQIATAQRQARLLAVLNALPEPDQACLHLRAEGLRYREIAEVVGMSLGAVSASLTRSMARMTRAAER
jgi:RNA polymerase sigma-70 factor, ECF subfamily